MLRRPAPDGRARRISPRSDLTLPLEAESAPGSGADLSLCARAHPDRWVTRVLQFSKIPVRSRR